MQKTILLLVNLIIIAGGISAQEIQKNRYSKGLRFSEDSIQSTVNQSIGKTPSEFLPGWCDYNKPQEIMNAPKSTSLYSEDFESGYSDGLLGTSPVNGWAVGVEPVNCGQNYWGVYATGSYSINNRGLKVTGVDGSCNFYPGEYLISSTTNIYVYTTIDAGGYESLSLDFSWISDGEIYSGAYYDYGTVIYRTGTSGTWQTLTTGGNDGLGKYAGQTTTQTESLSLPSSLDNNIFQIGFRWQSDNAYGTYGGFVIDNISIAGNSLGTPPSCTTPVMPADASSGHSPADPLEWNPAAGATSYDVYLGTSSNPAYVTNVTGTSYSPALSENTNYYWKIVPRNAYGEPTGCDIWEFTTGAAPASGDYRTRFTDASWYGWNNPDNWEVYNGSSWQVATNLPGSTNHVLVQENSQYVVLNNPMTSSGTPATCKNLTIKGTLQFWNGINTSTDAYGDLNIYGDLTIMPSGTLETFMNVTNIEAVSAIDMVEGGNITNYGTLDLYDEYDNRSYTFAWINFYGSSTSTFSLQSGSSTRLFYIQIVKDNPTDQVVFNINENFLAVNNENSGNNGFLKSYNMNSWDDTPQGHLIIRGNYAKNNPVWFMGLTTYSLGFNTSNGIASNLTVEIDNPDFGVMAQNVTFNLGGTLIISRGQCDIGATSGSSGGIDQSAYYLNILNGGALTINGGLLNTRAGIAGNGTHSFTMTDGLVNVGRNANASSRGLFDLQGNPQVTISGGKISMTDNRYVSNNLGYRVDDGNISITGGTLQIGTSYSPAGSNTFSIQGHAPSIELYTDGSSIYSNAIMWNDVACHGGLNIPAGCQFSVWDQDNGDIPYTFSLTGDLIHSGTIHAELDDSKILFNGSAPQEFNTTGSYNSGMGTAGISVLEIDNASGVNMTGNGTSVTKTLVKTNGTFNLGDCFLQLYGNVSRTNGYLGGNSNSELYIYGSGSTGNLYFDATADSLKLLSLDRSSGTINLATDVKIGQAVNFTNGIVYTYLDGNPVNNSKTIYLASDAELVNENNNSHIYGTVSISKEIDQQTLLTGPETFDSDILVHGSSASTTVWFAPDSNDPVAHETSGGCSGGRIGYTGSWNSYWGNFVRVPEVDCSGYDEITLSFDVSHSYFASQTDDWCRFYMWADGGYKHNVTSVKIDGIDVTYDAGANGKGFQYTESRSCASVEVSFDISGITDKSNILLYLEAYCKYNNSNEFYTYFDNISVSGTQSGSSSSEFGNVWAVMNNISDDLGDVTVTRVTGIDGISAISNATSIECYWDIETENPPLSPINITFKWLDLFDNSQSTSAMSVFSLHDPSPWAEMNTPTSVSGNPRNIAAEANDFSKWTIAVKNTPLPVELLHFDAGCEGNETILSWTTLSELNADYFLVQASGDKSDFKNIAEIKARGTSNQRSEYQYVFNNIETDATYFRLKQVDIDGSFEYSDIIYSDCKQNGFTDLEFFPNPFDGSTFSLQINKSMNNTHISVFDSSGRHLDEIKTSLNSGINDIKLSKQLDKGMYIIEVKTSDILIKRFPVVVN